RWVSLAVLRVLWLVCRRRCLLACAGVILIICGYLLVLDLYLPAELRADPAGRSVKVYVAAGPWRLHWIRERWFCRPPQLSAALDYVVDAGADGGVHRPHSNHVPRPRAARLRTRHPDGRTARDRCRPGGREDDCDGCRASCGR